MLAEEKKGVTFMIPKIIHYCWFGNSEIPPDEASYIEGWKRKLPDYEFRLWNESNFDVNSTEFTRQTARVKKWAFVSDYAHVHAIYHYGGISLDTDVEVIKPLDDLLERNACFSGFEDGIHVAPGLIFGGEKGCVIAKKLMDIYSNFKILNKDGSLNLISSPEILTAMLLKYGLRQDNSYQHLGDMTVYPMEFFCPKSFKTGLLNITDNTYSIHHFKASWVSNEDVEKIKKKWDVFAKYGENELTILLTDLMDENENLKTNNINTMKLFKIYKVAVKRTIKRIFGKK
jgi:mannosyltransferase OCH1-like enzyme